MRIEHVALNVSDPVAMAAWYCKHLGMRIVRKGPPPVNARFMAASTGNVILEIYTNPPDAVPDYAAMNPLLLHVAFLADDVAAARDKLVTAGASVVSDLETLPNGDVILMLRDPWGLAIQFVKRAEAML